MIGLTDTNPYLVPGLAPHMYRFRQCWTRYTYRGLYPTDLERKTAGSYFHKQKCRLCTTGLLAEDSHAQSNEE